MTAENIKFAESFGAVQSADGNYNLTADALNHLIETAKNMGRLEESNSRLPCNERVPFTTKE